jgi:hypothetical protein
MILYFFNCAKVSKSPHPISFPLKGEGLNAPPFKGRGWGRGKQTTIKIPLPVFDLLENRTPPLFKGGIKQKSPAIRRA